MGSMRTLDPVRTFETLLPKVRMEWGAGIQYGDCKGPHRHRQRTFAD